ncbi:MAG: ankyrin repeat domain-containing protein [Polyangiales bacterium]
MARLKAKALMNYDDEQKIRAMSETQLAEEPRTEEEIEYWFSVLPKRKKWKAGQTKEWRVRLAQGGAPENRALLLKPFIDKKPSRVDFNTAHVAAVLGTPEAFALAKSRKADFSAVWLKRNSMCIAAALGHTEFIKWMFDDGCAYELVETSGNFAARLSPLRFAIAGGHSDVVELLKEHATPDDLREALRVGNLDALKVLKEHSDLPDSFVCADEKTTLEAIAILPDVSPSSFVCNGPSGADLAAAIVAKHPAMDAGEILPHMSRMNVDGLKALFDACAKLDKKVVKHSAKTTLANVAMESNRVDVLRALVERGSKPTGIKKALKSDTIYEEMRTYLGELDAQ